MKTRIGASLVIRFLLLFSIITGSFMLFLSCNMRSKTENDLERMDLEGKVKSMTQVNFNGKNVDGDIQKEDMRYYTIYLFNDYGNISEWSFYGPDSLRMTNEISRFDIKGKVVEKKHYEKTDELVNKETFKYDEKGNLWERVNINEITGIRSRETYKYDNKGMLIETDFNSAGGRKIFTISIDEKGHSRRDTVKGPGQYEMKTIYVNDKAGHRIEEKSVSSDGITGTIRRNKFDEKGKKIETGVYGSDNSLLFKQTYLYDAKGRIVEEQAGSSDDNMITVRTYSYNERGSITEEFINYGLRSSIIRYSYGQYDIDNNWQSRTRAETSTSGGKEYYTVTERIIEYY